jgi:hypothetical protein
MRASSALVRREYRGLLTDVAIGHRSRNLRTASSQFIIQHEGSRRPAQTRDLSFPNDVIVWTPGACNLVVE